jgi:hypothetical protein
MANAIKEKFSNRILTWSLIDENASSPYQRRELVSFYRLAVKPTLLMLRIMVQLLSVLVYL